MCKRKEKKITNIEKLIHQLTIIRNSAFCSYTLPRARRMLNKIKPELTAEEYNQALYHLDNIDIENPDVYTPTWARTGDYKRQLMHQRANFANYVHSLIEKRKLVN